MKTICHITAAFTLLMGCALFLTGESHNRDFFLLWGICSALVFSVLAPLFEKM